VHVAVASPDNAAPARPAHAAPRKIEMDVPSAPPPLNPLVQAVQDEQKEKEQESAKGSK
jgi:hypothetical protein